MNFELNYKEKKLLLLKQKYFDSEILQDKLFNVLHNSKFPDFSK